VVFIKQFKQPQTMIVVIIIGIIATVILMMFGTKADAHTPSNDIGELVPMESTAYTWTGDPCANGKYPKIGICAAAPEWIGLTCVMYENNDGHPGDLIGIYEIYDTGSDYRIQEGLCIDVYLDSKEECLEWGRKQVICQIIDAKG